MRRLVFPAILASGLVMMGAVPAYAEPAPTAASAKAAAGKKVCKVTDPLLAELSGIVATKNGFVVVNDSADAAGQRKIFFLDEECRITDKVDYPSRPLDAEDLVLGPDGDTLWIADIGDNSVRNKSGQPRRTIGLWSMPLTGGKEPTIHRVSYPKGDEHDAEALLFNGDGTPIIVTKEVSGKTLLYTPATALKKNNDQGVPLKKAGEIELPDSDTPGIPIARLAQTTVTGGAVAPGGGRVTLRTYLDAYEWDVADGDVLGALKNKPRKTALPNEPFGEAITYSADGKLFYTVSDMGTGADPDAANYILRYTPATKIVEATTDAAAADAADDDTSWYSDPSLTDIMYLVGAVGVLGLLLVGAGVFGIVRARKKRKLEPVVKDPDPDPPTTGPDPLDAETELLSVGGPPQRPGTYGGKPPPAGAASGPGVYGGKPGPAAPPAKGNGVYGGGQPPQGGRPGQGGQPAGRPAGGRPGVPPAGPGPGGGQPARPGQPGGGRPGQGGQPAGRPGQGGGQPAGRPGQPPARPPQGGQPGGGGVYGAPPPPPPTRRPQGGGPQRPSGSLGPGGGQPGGSPQGGRQPGRPDGGRQANGMNNYANQDGFPGRGDGRFDNPGYGRPTRGR